MPSKEVNTKFEEVYKQYFRKIYNYAYYLTQSRFAAEDLCSEAFTSTYVKLCELNSQIDNIQAWLFRCVKNAFINLSIKDKRYVNNDIVLANLVSPGEKVDEQIDFANVMKVIDRELTPPVYKEVLVLKYKFELENDEIASTLNISTDNVRQITKRALYKLRTIL